MTINRDGPRGPLRRESSNIVSTGDRTITFLASDQSVARDGHVVITSGLKTANYKNNAVMLWAHDSSQPPIAKCTRLYTSGTALYATMEFVDASLYPFGDTIFQMYKQGIMNAVSISWLPLEWKYSNDPSRPGGIDFLSTDLLEISAVPIPALASALVTARARGINVRPMEDWLSRSPCLDAKARAVRLAEVARLHRDTVASDRRAEIAASAPPSTRAERIAEARALAARVVREDEAAARRPIFKF